MHQCNWRGVVSDRVYRMLALPTQGMGPDVVKDVSTEEPEAFFVAPWTCLLLIRASKLVESKGPSKPCGRAQFEGIVGPVLFKMFKDRSPVTSRATNAR